MSILYDILIWVPISHSYFLQHFVYAATLSFKLPQHICNHSSHIKDRFPSKFISSSQHLALYYDRTCSFCCANFNSWYFDRYYLCFSIGVLFYFIVENIYSVHNFTIDNHAREILFPFHSVLILCAQCICVVRHLFVSVLCISKNIVWVQYLNLSYILIV